MNAQKIHYTRGYVRYNHPTRRHPWLGLPLPINDRRRGTAQEGHRGAVSFERNSSNNTSDVSTMSLGSLMYPKDDENATTHVRSKVGGYVSFWAKKDHANHTEYLRSSRQRKRRQTRNSRLGSERRRWVFRNGKAKGRGGKGKKKVGAERKRDERGRFI